MRHVLRLGARVFVLATLPGCIGQLVPGTAPLGENAPALVGSPLPTPTPPAFSVTGASPAEGPLSGGTTLTVTGTALPLTTVVTVGGSACPMVSQDATTLVCTVPAGGAIGFVNIVASVPSGPSGTLTNGFRYRQRARVNVASVTKLTTAGPILRTGLSSGGDIHRYLIGLGNGWRPSVYPNGSNFEFVAPCKPTDSGGWYLCGARWDGVSATGAWIDNNSLGLGGIDPIISSYGGAGVALNDGSQLGNTILPKFVFHSGKVRGFVQSFSRNRLIYAESDSLELFGPSSFDTAITPQAGLVFANDNSFLGGTDFTKAHLFSLGGVLALWRVTTNAPTNSTSYLTYAENIGATLGNFVEATAPSTTIAGAQTAMFVTHYGESYIAIRCDVATNSWRAFYGEAPTALAATPDDNLLIAGQLGAPGAWDSIAYDNASQCPGNFHLIGSAVQGTKLLVFYMAGDFDYPGAPPYGVPRGIGVLRYDLDEY